MERKMSNQNLLTFANIVIFVILREKFCIILARKAHMEIDVMRDAMIVIIIFNCTCIIGHVTFFYIFIFYNSENALHIDFRLYILLQVQMEASSRKKPQHLKPTNTISIVILEASAIFHTCSDLWMSMMIRDYVLHSTGFREAYCII